MTIDPVGRLTTPLLAAARSHRRACLSQKALLSWRHCASLTHRRAIAAPLHYLGALACRTLQAWRTAAMRSLRMRYAYRVPTLNPNTLPYL
jgi:hypothetical protein